MTPTTEKIIALFPEILRTRTIEEVEAIVLRNGLVAIGGMDSKLTAEERKLARALKSELKSCIKWLKADQCSYVVGRRAELVIAIQGSAAEYARTWARTMFPLNAGEEETNWSAIAEEIAPEFEEFVSLLSKDEEDAA